MFVTQEPVCVYVKLEQIQRVAIAKSSLVLFFHWALQIFMNVIKLVFSLVNFSLVTRHDFGCHNSLTLNVKMYYQIGTRIRGEKLNRGRMYFLKF